MNGSVGGSSGRIQRTHIMLMKILAGGAIVLFFG
jgi:hypothetical protein